MAAVNLPKSYIFSLPVGSIPDRGVLIIGSTDPAAFRLAHGAAIGLIYPHAVRRPVTIIDMWHRTHPEACRDCREWGVWEPATCFGVLVSDGPRLVDCALVQRLLVP